MAQEVVEQASSSEHESEESEEETEEVVNAMKYSPKQ
jgi:hypothetical protein